MTTILAGLIIGFNVSFDGAASRPFDAKNSSLSPVFLSFSFLK
jgi:hypothetical protein